MSLLATFSPNWRTIAVVCNQWGDTGKGKFVDLFGEWADIIARGTGGANAGHTIVVGSTTHIMHLIPSGILHDSDGKTNIIGNGVAFDPQLALSEIATLTAAGISFDHLRIAHNAKLVMPWHLALDRLSDAGATTRIGTTGRGIGPCYGDFVVRVGLTVNDMLNVDSLATKVRARIKDVTRQISRFDPEAFRQVMMHKHLGSGRFYSPNFFFDADAIISAYTEWGRALEGLIADTDRLLRGQVGKKNILLEGAQGLLLSVDHGSYPFVTSSDCSIEGLAKGVGLNMRHVDRTFGIVKAFYMTRVGEGPFPTELGGVASAEHCGTHGVTRDSECVAYGNASDINDSDEFCRGIAIRQAGNEYGATTGRPRRVGWLDLPLLRYAVGINGTTIVLTKVDVLNECELIPVCFAYRYLGPRYRHGEKLLEPGSIITTAIPDAAILSHCQPIYETFLGWECSLDSITDITKLPENLRAIIRFVEHETGASVAMVSTGASRNAVAQRM